MSWLMRCLYSVSNCSVRLTASGSYPQAAQYSMRISIEPPYNVMSYQVPQHLAEDNENPRLCFLSIRGLCSDLDCKEGSLWTGVNVVETNWFRLRRR